jgi:DNA-binding IclR family transcriptional regulator
MRTIKSLEKGLQILSIIADFPNGARVKEINEKMEEPVSNLTLFLNSLSNSGFITKNVNSGKYFISQKVSNIAEKADRAQYSLLKECSADSMKRIREELNENVLLAVLSGHDIRFIERVFSQRSIQIRENTDIYYPPHVTAGGKVILAFMPKIEQNKYLDSCLYHQFTDKSLINPKMLRQELMVVKEMGYAVNRGEFEDEIMAVAAPVNDGVKVVGSLVVQFPKFRYKEENLPEFGERIVQGALEIQSAIQKSIN